MLGSAVQNVIALTDSVFLYHTSEADFASIGFVGVFYLVVAAIGYGFSRGGQILIARRYGEQSYDRIGRTFYAILYFELGLALALYLFMYYGTPWFFKLFVDSDIIYHKSLEYLSTRSWGVFFSYIGVTIVALYTGIARTWFIVIDTLILALVNIVLNYGFIYGRLGMPEMGIAGAGLASSIAEAVAFVIFLVYMIQDKHIRQFRIFRLPSIDWDLIKRVVHLGAPIVAQSIVGLGSWFIFFGIVENMGERQLAVTNLVRMVYLILSIPCWGFASGVNTLVSNFIGARKRQAVFPIIWKTAKLCFFVTMFLTIPMTLFPEVLLYPLLGSSDMSLIQEAKPILKILLIILALFSVAGVFFSGVVGTGATLFGLMIQALCALLYLVFVYLVVDVYDAGLVWAWSSEIFYWILVGGITTWYLRSDRWHYYKF
ncbi:MAG: MATE family efflux transporter [Saprospiraceae bacterium]|nr:MATE family efflux transporter [Saprospiraceae bacterium]